MKFLEMYVSVGESAGLQDCLADACSAIGTIYNTMVGNSYAILKQSDLLSVWYFVG